MSINSLLEKAALYEKLAAFSDRSTFLKSLGQTALSQDIKDGVKTVVDNLSAAPPSQAFTTVNNLIDYSSGMKTDLTELVKELKEAGRLIPASTNQPQARHALELAKKVENLIPKNPQDDLYGGQSLKDDMASPLSNINDYPTAKPVVKHETIPTDVQEKLNELNMKLGWGFKIFPGTKADGIVGKETRKALDKFKYETGLQIASNDAVYAAINKMYSDELSK